MSDAVEGAEVMLYGVSKRYKESANCRMEAQYGNARKVCFCPGSMYSIDRIFLTFLSLCDVVPARHDPAHDGEIHP